METIEVPPSRLAAIPPAWWLQLFNGQRWRLDPSQLPGSGKAQVVRALCYRRAAQMNVVVRVVIEAGTEYVHVQRVVHRGAEMAPSRLAVPAPAVPMVEVRVSRRPFQEVSLHLAGRIDLLNEIRRLAAAVQQNANDLQTLLAALEVPDEGAETEPETPQRGRPRVFFEAPPLPEPEPEPVDPRIVPAPLAYFSYPRELTQQELDDLEAAEILARCTCGSVNVSKHEPDCAAWG